MTGRYETITGRSWRNTMRKVFFVTAVILAYQVVMLFYGRAWLGDLVPTDDFGGGVAVVGEIKAIAASGTLSNWSHVRFSGSPNTILWSFGDWFAYLPFAYVLSPVMAVKVGSLVYLGLAGSAMFALAFYFTNRRLLSFWAGLATMVSPIYLFNAIQTGHTNFPPFYAIQPLAFLALWRLCERWDRRRLLWGALTVVFMVWIDTERAFTALPVMICVVLLGSYWYRPTGSAEQFAQWFGRRAAYLAGAAAVAVLLGAWFMVPLLCESQHAALFSEAVLTESRATFGLNNPLYLLDRNGWLVGKLAAYLPNRDCFDASNYYLGISTLAVALVVLLARRPNDPRIRLARGALVGCTGLIWAASGMTSMFANLTSQMGSLYGHLNYAQEHPYLLPLVGMTGIVVAASIAWLRRRLRCPPISLLRLAVVMGLLLLVIYTPIFRLLAKVPLYAHMRNAGYFVSALPPLLLVLAGTLTLDYFLRGRSQRVYICVLTLVVALTLLDYGVYRKGFDRQIPPAVVSEFQAASEAMRTSSLPGRYLSRESYNPLADMHTVFAQRDTAWYWLNWSCPKPTHHAFMELIYPKLHKPDTINEALALAGLFDVRFVTYDLTQGPLPPATDFLAPLFTGRYYAVFENRSCRDYVQLYPLDEGKRLPGDLTALVDLQPTQEGLSGWQQVGPDHLVIDIDAAEPGLLVVSQSCYPGWQAYLDRQPVELRSVGGILPALAVPAGVHQVVLKYIRPWYFHASALLSLLSLSVCIYWVFIKAAGRQNRAVGPTRKSVLP